MSYLGLWKCGGQDFFEGGQDFFEGGGVSTFIFIPMLHHYDDQHTLLRVVFLDLWKSGGHLGAGNFFSTACGGVCQKTKWHLN